MSLPLLQGVTGRAWNETSMHMYHCSAGQVQEYNCNSLQYCLQGWVGESPLPCLECTEVTKGRGGEGRGGERRERGERAERGGEGRGEEGRRGEGREGGREVHSREALLLRQFAHEGEWEAEIQRREGGSALDSALRPKRNLENEK